MTMANLQKLNPTQQELYNYLEQQTGQVNFEVLQPFTTQEMGTVLHISRNTVSQYLNEFFKEGWMVKINTRPVYYFLRETLSRKFNVQTLDAEYEDLQFLQQDLNHGRRADSCFAGVIGYHLSLKSAVEKCRVAVEYPPTGLPLVLAGRPYKEMENRLLPIAERLGITELLEKYPYEVSGGQKQRAAVARALITNPRLILADEPTGALDSHTTDSLLSLFSAINEGGQTLLMVTHSVKAASHAGRVLFLRDGEVYHQLYRGNMSFEEMFAKVSDTLTMLTTGGERHA